MELSSTLTVLGWFIQVIIDKGLTSALQYYSSVDSDLRLPEALETLRYAMNNIRTVLPLVLRIREENQGLLEWLKELKDAAYDADDVLDELDYHRLRQEVEGNKSRNIHRQQVSNPFHSRIRETGDFLNSAIASLIIHNNQAAASEPSSSSSTAVYVYRISNIAARLECVANCISRAIALLKPEELYSDQLRLVVGNRVTTSLMQSGQVVVGRNKERDQIIELLSHHPSGVSVLPIVGIGGVGKTTLAQMVYNDERVKRHFELRMWVCVSDIFNVLRLTQEVLECLGVDSSDRTANLNRMQEALVKELCSYRFLLVLDDVWNDTEITKWGVFCSSLQSGKQGSRILMTTRLDTVATVVGKLMDTMGPIKLDGLPEGEYQSFFSKCAFQGENPEDHPKLVAMGTQIVEKLCGSPLAAMTVGGLLRERLEDEHWRSILMSDLWELRQGPDDIMPVLRLSFHYLPEHLQRCFAYCSVFPREWRFKSDELVSMWVAQGFIDQVRTTAGKKIRLEDTGREYFNSLRSRSFFKPTMESDEFVVHNLLHDLAKSLCPDESFRIDENNQWKEIPSTVRHVFAYPYMTGTLIKTCNLGKLRTLIITGEVSDSTSLETLFRELKSIRVLCLSKEFVLPDNMGHLMHLRYLQISKYVEVGLPDSLCKLYHLQWLGYLGVHATLPISMNNLVSLRHCFNLAGQLGGIGTLTSLQELESFFVERKVGWEIGQLKYLRELRGILQLYRLENVFSKEESMEADLSKKEHIRILGLHWTERSRAWYEVAMEEEVLEGLEPPLYTEELTIEGYGGVRSPTWMLLGGNRCPLFHLESLSLIRCTEWKDLPSLGQLPFLKNMHIVSAHAVEEIGSIFYGSSSFPCLETLELEDMIQLKMWHRIEDCRLFSRLQELNIKFCPNLQSLVQLKNLPSLKRLTLECCYKLESMPLLPASLQVLRVTRCYQLVTIFNEEQEDTLSELTDLQELHIRSCPHLDSLPAQLKCLPSLVVLSVQVCDKLRSLPVMPTSLRQLSVDGCSEVVTLFFQEQEETLSMLTFLEELAIRFCTSLQSLPEELKRLPSLKQLAVEDCNMLQSLPLMPTSLVFLSVQRCTQLPRERYLEGGADWNTIAHIPEVIWSQAI